MNLAFTTLHPTISEIVLNQKNLKSNWLDWFILPFLGSMMIAGLAQLSIPLPFTPVPITGQTFAVLLAACLLGPRGGTLAVAYYLLEGLVGLPVFSNATSGAAVFLGPKAGYLLGFLLAAPLVGLAVRKRKMDRSIRTAIPAFFVAHTVVFIFGVTGLKLNLGISFEQALALGYFPFLLGEVVKVGLLSTILPAFWSVLDSKS